jgi:hypothetical protein
MTVKTYFSTIFCFFLKIEREKRKSYDAAVLSSSIPCKEGFFIQVLILRSSRGFHSLHTRIALYLEKNKGASLRGILKSNHLCLELISHHPGLGNQMYVRYIDMSGLETTDET